MYNEGFPFVIWRSRGWTLVRLEWLVGSASRRRGVLNSVSMAAAAKLLLLKISKQDITSFCMAGITYLIMHRKWQNWTKSCTKCSFCCAHVSRLESLLFPWRRHIYGADFHINLRGRYIIL